MRRLLVRWLIAVLVLAAPILPAQQKKRASSPPPPAPAVYPLASLRIEGNRRLSVEKIVAVTGLKTGEPVLRSDFDHARQRLMATGAFESVAYEFKPSPDGKAYDGLLKVVEIEQVFPYRFEDLPAADDALRAALRKQEPILDDRIPATREVIDRYVAAILEFLDGKVQVTGKLMSDVPGRHTIVFRPPTPRPNIAEVHFTGNDVLPTTLLANTLAGVAVGVPYSDASIRQLLDASIRPLYEARGRVHVTFPKIDTERIKTKNLDGVSVTVAIDEGVSYNLGTVRIAGVPAGDVAALEKTAKWRAGDVANFDDIKDGIDRILHRLKGNGYLRVSAKTDRDIHDQDHTVDLVVTLNTGPQFVFGKLTIQGLDVLTEPAIRKVWSLKEGKPFDPEYPDNFLKNLREEGVFENLGETRAEPHIHEAQKTVDVTLFFSGSKPTDKEKGKIGIP